MDGADALDAPESDSQHTDTNEGKISSFVSVKFPPGSDRMYLIPQTVSESGSVGEDEYEYGTKSGVLLWLM